MARQETIEVKLQKAQGYDSTVKSLQDEANKLKATFESIKVGNATQQLNAQAAASRAAAQAAADNLRVQKEQVNLDNARQRSIRDLTATQAEQTRLAREQADLGAANLRVQREQVNLNNANTRSVRDLADANAANIRVQTEQVNLQNAQIRQQNLLNQGNQRQQTALRNLGNVVGAVNAAQAQSIQQMRQFIQNQNNLNNANVTATGVIRNAAGTFQTYNAAVTEAGGVTHNYRFAVDEATGAVYQLDRGIRSTSLTVRDLSSILRSVRTLIGFTGVAQSMRYAFTEMKSMSDEMIVYQKVTKASADEMERLRASAYESAKRYGQTPTDFLSAASEMARAGYKENSAAMADLATKTKLVGDITAEEASRFLLAVDAGYQYGGSIEKLANVLDMTNEVSNNFATNTAKISEGMTLVASLGAQANIPIEQLIAALGTMTAATQRSGSEMARALRFTILNVLGDTTTEVEEGVKVTAEEVNNMSTALQYYAKDVVNAAKQSGKLINPMEAIGALAKAYKDGLIGTQEELFKLSKDIAGQRYYNAFAALIQNWDTMYQEMLDKEAMAAGSADAEISVLVNSWTTKFNQLKTTWTELVNNSINEGFIKNLIDSTTHVLSFAGSLENLASMAGGALFAIRSLSAGIRNLRQPGALMNLNTFGGFNLATGIAGIGVAAYGIIKSAYEANQRALQEAAKKAAESAVASATTYTSLEELTKKYDEIAKDGIQEEKGELEELKSLQDQLNGLVGDQATAIDIVNGKYGETLTALKKLNEEQRKNLLETARANLSSAVASFIGADLNGEYFGNYTGVSGLPGQSAALMDYINALQYFRVSRRDSPDPLDMALYLTNVPTVDKDIIQFYKELQDLYNYIGSHNLRGEKAGLGEKTIGEEQNYTRMYSALGKFLQEVEKTAKPVKEAYESVETLSGDLEEIGGDGSGSGDGSANGAADSIEELTESIHTLTKSIENATTAKEKFDDAMKTSKADAFKDYMEAFDTFKQELDAGRVNSTAMYAAARMMLGKDAYNATGGTYAGVMQAMYNRGSAGTVLDAYQILNTEYVDKQGRTIEGFGAYELLRRSGVFGEGELTDANGNIFIPELTDAQYEQISAAYGGILVEVIMNALNSLDQYDTKGETTDAATAPETAEANEETTESTKNLGESAEKASKSVEDFSETVDEEKKEIEGDETSERVAQSAEYADAQVQAEQEAAALAVAEARAQAEQEAQQKMQESADKLDGLISKIQAINEATISPELLDLLDGLGKVKDKYTIAIETTGDETATAEQKIQAISSALDEIEKNKEIALKIGLPDTADDLESAKTSLIEEANGIISGVESSSELHSIMLNTRATAGSINHDLYMLISSAEASKKVSIPAKLGDTTQFKTDVGELAKDETKTITVSDNGTAEALGTVLDGVMSKLSAINSTTPDENIVNLIDGISKIKDTYTFAIQMSGNDSATTEQKILAISQALDEIEKNKDLAIGIGLPDAGEELEAAKSKLIQEANTIISGAEDSEDLHYLLVKAAAGEGTLNSDLQALITTAEENSSVTIGVTADTTDASAKIDSTSQGRSTSIYVNTPNAGSANANLNTVANPPEGRTAEIDAEADTNDAKTELEKTAEGRDTKITADAETNQAKTDLDAVAEGRTATIKPELKDAVPVAKTLELLANPTTGRTADVNVEVDKTSESAYNEKMAELTKPQTKLISVKAISAGGVVSQDGSTAKSTGLPTSQTSTDYSGNGLGMLGTGFGSLPGSGGSMGNYFTDTGEWIPKWASGTQFHPGGIALVNDGNGPELLISNGRAFIANDGKPALVNLQRGAKVFTASETRDILGGGVPAYAGGVGNYGTIGLGGYGDFSTKTDYEAAKALAEETANGAGNEAQKEAKAFSDLKDLIDYIINRVGMALEEQTGIIDQQIAELRAQREAGEQQNELEERQKAVAEAQKDMIDALNERTVRYLGEDGKWHWMADARNVQTATEALEKANQALLNYEDEMAFDAQIDALEAQKTALEDEYKKITKAWEDIQYGVNTPTGDLASLIAEIIATGSATDKKGAQTVQSLLIGQLLQGGIFKGNYSEALDSIAKATSGNPIMPGESTATLASLIATTAAMGTGTEVTDAMKAARMGAVQGGAYSGVTGGGTQTNFNYFINGIQLGSDQAGQPLSEIMRNLTVYTNTGVA